MFVLTMTAITTILSIYLNGQFCLQIMIGLWKADCVTGCIIVHQSLQVSGCLENTYVPRSAAAAMEVSNHHCCCAASYLTDGVVVRQSLHVLCSLEACLGGFAFQSAHLPFQSAHFLPGPFGICPQLLLFTLTLLLLAFPFILQSRQAKCADISKLWQGC